MMRDLGLIAKLPRIVVAQAERANPLYRSYLRNFEIFEPVQAQKTLASAIQIGNPVSFEKAVRTLKQFDGIVEQATEEELADAAALGDRTGMFNCPHTGVALAVLHQAAQGRQDRQVRARRGDLDRARPEVRRDEGQVSPEGTGVPLPAREPADRIAARGWMR